jgi:hypothetical protein
MDDTEPDAQVSEQQVANDGRRIEGDRRWSRRKEGMCVWSGGGGGGDDAEGTNRRTKIASLRHQTVSPPKERRHRLQGNEKLEEEEETEMRIACVA